MAEVGRILSQAGRDVGGAIGGIGESAIEVVIRTEQLRQQEFRSQLDLAELMQRQTVSAMQLAGDVRQMDLLESQIGLAGERFREEQEQFRIGAPLREAQRQEALARSAILTAQAETERVQRQIVEQALPAEEEEEGERVGIGDRIIEALPAIGRALGLVGPEPEAAPVDEVEPPAREPILTEEAQRVVGGVRQFLFPSPAEQVAQPPDTAQVVPEAQQAPLFEVPELPDTTDISLEEEGAAKAAFHQEVAKLNERVREQLRKGVGLEVLKDLLRRTAQATADIRRRNL